MTLQVTLPPLAGLHMLSASLRLGRPSAMFFPSSSAFAFCTWALRAWDMSCSRHWVTGIRPCNTFFRLLMRSSTFTPASPTVRLGIGHEEAVACCIERDVFLQGGLALRLRLRRLHAGRWSSWWDTGTALLCIFCGLLSLLHRARRSTSTLPARSSAHKVAGLASTLPFWAVRSSRLGKWRACLLLLESRLLRRQQSTQCASKSCVAWHADGCWHPRHELVGKRSLRGLAKGGQAQAGTTRRLRRRQGAGGAAAGKPGAREAARKPGASKQCKRAAASQETATASCKSQPQRELNTRNNADNNTGNNAGSNAGREAGLRPSLELSWAWALFLSLSYFFTLPLSGVPKDFQFGPCAKMPGAVWLPPPSKKAHLQAEWQRQASLTHDVRHTWLVCVPIMLSAHAAGSWWHSLWTWRWMNSICRAVSWQTGPGPQALRS